MTDLLTRAEAQALVDQAVAAVRGEMRAALQDFAALSIESHSAAHENIERLSGQLLAFMDSATRGFDALQTPARKARQHGGSTLMDQQLRPQSDNAERGQRRGPSPRPRLGYGEDIARNELGPDLVSRLRFGLGPGRPKAIRPLSSGLSTIGVSGLAAGLSITGLIGQFRDLARAVPALQELSRQSGISRTEIERLKYAAQNLNVDPSKMTAAIATFSEQMIQFEKHSGKVYNEMAYKSQGLANKIASEWRGDPAKALQDYLGWLNAIPEAQQRMGKSSQEGAQIQRHWTQEALGYADMAQIFAKGPQGFADAYVEATKNVHEITDELVAQSDAFPIPPSRSIVSTIRGTTSRTILAHRYCPR